MGEGEGGGGGSSNCPEGWADWRRGCRGNLRGAGGEAARAGGLAGRRVWVGGCQLPRYLPPPGFCTPGPGGGAPRAPAPRGGSPGAPAWAVVELGGWGPPPIAAALFLKPPSPAVDRLLVKWSLASSAPNRVEVSMMRKFCDTGVRKRLADTGGVGSGEAV